MPWTTGSQAERAVECPNSVSLSLGIEQTTNTASSKGTALHTVSYLLLLGLSDYEAIGSVDEKYRLFAQNLCSLRAYRAFIDRMDDGEISTAFNCQTKVGHDLVKFVDRTARDKYFCDDAYISGTLDFICIDRQRHVVEIWDFKTGVQTVDYKVNHQLLTYACCLFHTPRFREYEFVTGIAQTTADCKSVNFTSCSVSHKTLNTYGEKLHRAYQSYADLDYPYSVGKWCMFCPAKSICPKMQEIKQNKERKNNGKKQK